MTEEKLGRRIRQFRENLGLSVEELAQKAGIKAASVTAIECGEADPVLGVRIKLARALGQRLGTFMDDIVSADPVVTRAVERNVVRHPVHTPAETASSVTYFSMGKGKSNRAMEPFFIEFGAEVPTDSSSHEGEEFMICVSGEIVIEHGTKSYVLKPGDSIYYDAVVPHKVTAAGGNPASIYAVVFMPL